MNITAPDAAQIDAMLNAAHHATRNAYAPYSSYHVGAALFLSDGSILRGSNFENASYGLTLCAETNVIAAANSRGKLRDIIAIALAGGPPDEDGLAILTPQAVTPCGRCRQIIKEAADVSGRDILIYCMHKTGYKKYTLSQILPDAFGPGHIG